MGFSTAGSALIIFVAAFLAVGTLYTSGADAVERYAAGQANQLDRTTAITETAIEMDSAVWDNTSNTLTLEVTNAGETTLPVRQTTVVLDGRYMAVSDFETVTVDGRDTDAWRPGQVLRLQDDDTVLGLIDVSQPDRAKVVTAHGVAALSGVDHR